jgi:TPR repeat protein
LDRAINHIDSNTDPATRFYATPKYARFIKHEPPYEDEEQRILFAWLAEQEQYHPELSLCFHTANGKKRHMKTALELKAEGVKKGVPDIILPVARDGYFSLAIELKRQGGKGRESDEQKAWKACLNAQGWLAVVCKGAYAATQVITQYIQRPRTHTQHDGVLPHSL